MMGAPQPIAMAVTEMTTSSSMVEYLAGGNSNINITGGLGNDNITVTESSAGRTDQSTSQYGFGKVVIDAGADDDTITVQGSLNTSITTGSGVDTIRLTAHQYRTQQQGKRNLYDSNGRVNGTQNADPITITDFTTGEGGDILDYSDLLKCAAVDYNGENPFSTGHIKLVQSGKDTLFQFDADGNGQQHSAAYLGCSQKHHSQPAPHR